MQTIRTRVLEPARQRQQARVCFEQLARMRGWVSFAHQQINAAACCAYRDSHLADPEIQQGVRLVLQDAQRLLVLPKVIEAEVEAAPNATPPEERLRQLLVSINDACVQVQAMVPMSGKQFGRGHEFDPDTVRQVQQMWFNTSEAIAVLNQRQQLKRPNHWSEMRQEVMQPPSEDATVVPASSPEQGPPGDDGLASGGITGERQP